MTSEKISAAITEFCGEVQKGYVGVISIFCSEDELAVMRHGDITINTLIIDGKVFAMRDDSEEYEEDEDL